MKRDEVNYLCLFYRQNGQERPTFILRQCFNNQVDLMSKKIVYFILNLASKLL